MCIGCAKNFLYKSYAVGYVINVSVWNLIYGIVSTHVKQKNVSGHVISSKRIFFLWLITFPFIVIVLYFVFSKWKNRLQYLI